MSVNNDGNLDILFKSLDKVVALLGAHDARHVLNAD